MSGFSQLLSAAFQTLLMGVDDISQSAGGGTVLLPLPVDEATSIVPFFLKSFSFCVCIKQKISLFPKGEEGSGEQRGKEDH